MDHGYAEAFYLFFFFHLGIESHFVGVHGSYELHRKEKQIKCTAFTYIYIFYNKVCCDIAYFNTKMSYVSDFKRTKVRHLEKPSRRKTNWTNPPCDPVQIIRTKDWHFWSLIIVNTATSYFFTNLHPIHIWNGHRQLTSTTSYALSRTI